MGQDYIYKYYIKKIMLIFDLGDGIFNIYILKIKDINLIFQLMKEKKISEDFNIKLMNYILL